MSYTKQNFVRGQILTAAHLNHMEDGIAAAEQTGGSAALTIGTVTTGDAAAASITDGKLDLTLPKGDKGDKGDTGPQGAKGDTGPGITAKAKSLILELFAGAAYGNTTMQTQLDALKTEWGTSGSGGSSTPEEAQNTDPFPEVGAAYLLPTAKTFVPDEKEYIDTGVKLLESINPLPSFTILCEVKGGTGLTAESNKYVLLHCMEESSPWPGFVVQVNSADLRYTLYGSYHTLGTVSALKAEKQRLAMRCSAGAMSAHTMATDYVSNWGAVSGMTTAVDKSLLIGAMQESDGTKARFFNGTVYQCIVYQAALTDEQIMQWVNG